MYFGDHAAFSSVIEARTRSHRIRKELCGKIASDSYLQLFFSQPLTASSISHLLSDMAVPNSQQYKEPLSKSPVFGACCFARIGSVRVSRSTCRTRREGGHYKHPASNQQPPLWLPAIGRLSHLVHSPSHRPLRQLCHAGQSK